MECRTTLLPVAMEGHFWGGVCAGVGQVALCTLEKVLSLCMCVCVCACVWYVGDLRNFVIQ